MLIEKETIVMSGRMLVGFGKVIDQEVVRHGGTL